MKTYLFKVELVQEADRRWSATCPSLPGCATWGATREDALHNIQEAVEACVADLVESGEALPEEATVFDEPAVSVTV